MIEASQTKKQTVRKGLRLDRTFWVVYGVDGDLGIPRAVFFTKQKAEAYKASHWTYMVIKQKYEGEIVE